MKLSLMYFHELAMNRINTYQVYNNLSMFMKLSLMKINELPMNKKTIGTYQVHKKNFITVDVTHKLRFISS